jgi:hypothetical protein
MHTVIGTADQLAKLIGSARADGRLVKAGIVRPLSHGRYLIPLLLRQPIRRELPGRRPGRARRIWRSIRRRVGRNHLIATAAGIAVAGLITAAIWLIAAILVPAIATVVGWLIAHGVYILGGLITLAVITGLIAGVSHRCPTCGR